MHILLPLVLDNSILPSIYAPGFKCGWSNLARNSNQRSLVLFVTVGTSDLCI